MVFAPASIVFSDYIISGQFHEWHVLGNSSPERFIVDADVSLKSQKTVQEQVQEIVWKRFQKTGAFWCMRSKDPPFWDPQIVQ